MKLNNKGITLVEIIISIALISIVLIFLFSLLVTVNDMNDEAEVNSTYLINKALILKNIEEDLSKEENDEITISTCTIGGTEGFYKSYDTYYDSLDEIYKANECIKIKYKDNSYGYLGIYYYKNKESYVISYIHGNIKATRILPEFEKYNVSNGIINNPITFHNYIGNVCKYTASGIILDYVNGSLGYGIGCGYTNEKNFYKIEVPIIGEDGKDYTILISYYGIVRVE